MGLRNAFAVVGAVHIATILFSIAVSFWAGFNGVQYRAALWPVPYCYGAGLADQEVCE